MNYRNENIIEIKNLSYSLKKFSLNNINLNLQKGKFHVILGSTRSGKTLLLEILAGMISIEKNKLFFDNRDAYCIPPENRNLAYLPQDIVLFPNKNVFENIAYALII